MQWVVLQMEVRRTTSGKAQLDSSIRSGEHLVSHRRARGSYAEAAKVMLGVAAKEFSGQLLERRNNAGLKLYV